MLDFSKEVQNIRGWLSRHEGIFLYETARKVKKNAIVEIGSWKGKSTICLARGSQDGHRVKIYAIDPHTGSSEHQKLFKNKNINTFVEFKQNIKKAGIASYIHSIVNTSQNAAKSFRKPIGFVFIDGAHEFDLVNQDFKLWFPRVVTSGLIAIHDSWFLRGPSFVTAIALLVSSKVKNPKMIDTVTCFEKAQKISFFDRLKNLLFLIYRALFGAFGFLRLKYTGTNP